MEDRGWDGMLSSSGVNRSYHMRSPRTARGLEGAETVTTGPCP